MIEMPEELKALVEAEELPDLPDDFRVRTAMTAANAAIVFETIVRLEDIENEQIRKMIDTVREDLIHMAVTFSPGATVKQIAKLSDAAAQAAERHDDGH